jgi:hypothetical protein
MSKDTTSTAIQVTVADTASGLAFHRPGCQHLRSLRNPRDGERDAETLRGLHAEAKELNETSPIAPCLRKEVGG